MASAVRRLGSLSMARGCARIDAGPDTAKIGSADRVQVHHARRFMGDGVLVYFGWPQALEDAAERAVRAGLAIVEAVERLERAGGALSARVGIATGLVVVGDLIVEGAAQEEDVVGVTPNLAARLEQLAEPGAVVISRALGVFLAAGSQSAIWARNTSEGSKPQYRRSVLLAKRQPRVGSRPCDARMSGR